MRALAVSRTSKLSAAALALVLACTLGPVAMADESQVDPAAGGVEADVADAEGAPMLASLMASGAGHISTAVALEDDPEPVVGSFTVDGLTYAIVGEGEVALVAVGPGAAALAAGSSGADGEGRDIGSGVPSRSVAEQVPSGATSPRPQPSPSAGASAQGDSAGGAAADGAAALGKEDADGSGLEGSQEPVVLEVPESVEYDGSAYSVVAIGPRAFAGCEADVVAIPATVEFVDELALRGSAGAAIEVADGNAAYSSYDGMLFDAERISLLLIPEGKQGAARIPSTAEAVPPSAFSHCVLVTSISVDAGSAAYLSRNGLLYDASGETLLRVPAGATEIVIADGCTAVAAGALEGCASLRSVRAPAGVAEVSPDVLGRSAADAAAEDGVPAASAGSLGQIAVEGGGLAAAAGDDGGQVAVVGDAHAAEDDPAEGSQASSGSEGGEPSAEAEAAAYGAGVDGPAAGAEVPADDAAPAPVQLTSLVALAAAGDDLAQVDPASIIVSIPEGADPAPWEAVGFKVEAAPADAADDAEPVEGEPLGDLVTDDAHDHDAEEPDGASSDGPVIVDEVTIGYGYANERSMDSYERAIPKVDAVLELQPLTAEELMEDEANAEEASAPADAAGAAEGEAALASRLADLPEESQATASFLYEGCLYVIDPEGGAALVAVDPKRLAECVEDPTTLILPDYVDDGTWSYRLTRIAKGALAGSGVERLWIPASATYLDYALEGCETLRYVEISEENPAYSSRNGCLYDKIGTSLYWNTPNLTSTYENSGQEPSNLPRSSSVVRDSALNLRYASSEQSVSTAQHEALQVAKTSKARLSSSALSDTASDPYAPPNPMVVYYPTGHTAQFERSLTPEKQEKQYKQCTQKHTSYSSSSFSTKNNALGAYDGKLIATHISLLTADVFTINTQGYSSDCHNGKIVKWSPGGPKVLETEIILTSPVYIHCYGTADRINVWWHPNDGVSPSTLVKTDIGGRVTIPTPTRQGYKFLGWFTAKEGGTLVYEKETTTEPLTSTQNFYAHWAAPYTATFNPMGGVGGTQSTYVTPGSTIAQITTPTLSGWTFRGYTDDFGTQSFLFVSASGRGTTRTITNDKTLYANWTKTVTLDANEGTAGSLKSITAGIGRPLGQKCSQVASSNVDYPIRSLFKAGITDKSDWAPTRTGYTFAGYYDTSASTGGTCWITEDGTGEEVTSAIPSTLYARWTPNTYTVKFSVNGGAGSGYQTADKTATYGSAMPAISTTKPTRTGYTFMGWYDNSNYAASGAKQYYTDACKSARSWDKASDATLYAGWKAKDYVVTLDDARGTGASQDMTITYNKALPDVQPPVLPGWEFRGYARSFGPSVNLWWDRTGHSPFVQGDVDGSVYAQWTKSVALDPNGGSAGSLAQLPAGIGRPLGQKCSPSRDYAMNNELSAFLSVGITDNADWAPTRMGYTFAGYYDTSASTGGTRMVSASGQGSEVAKDTPSTLYARWAPLSYGISYDCAGGELPQGAREGYATGDAFDLAAPARYGYQFDGWEVAGAQGAGVETVAAPDGSKVTRVKAGTYGDLSCTARWTLRYDLDVPVCDPGSVTFEADSLTGQVRVAPGTSADGAILSYMAVPVALDSVSCEGLDSSGAVDASGGAPELEAIFGAGSAAKVRFTATVGEGEGAATAKVTAGGASGSASLAGLSVPAATSHADPGRVKVSYGLELDPGLAVPPVRDAAPVARLAYTVSLPPAGA